MPHLLRARSLALIPLLVLGNSLRLTAQITEARPNPPTITVMVAPPAADASKVPDTLFGGFLEPLRGSINQGLSAEILINPSFESGLWNQAQLNEMFLKEPDLPPSNDRFDLPFPWLPLDAKAGRRFMVRYGDAANSWQSLDVMGVSGYRVGVVQRVYLPVQRTLHYNVSLYARHLQGTPKVTVFLRLPGAKAALSQTEIEVDQTAWKKYSGSFTLSQGAIKPLQQVEFGIEVPSDARIDLDEVSLMPSDAIDGMDADVVAMAKAMNVTELRLGGNFTSTYHWRDGIGPADRRVSMKNLPWGVPEYNTFGTDEFLEFCRLIGAEPQFDLNMGSGTPDEAAQWVSYIHQHYRGKVLYELGNELYHMFQAGWIPGDQIGARTLAFSKAVRSVDPAAEIIATGERPNSFKDWNRVQLAEPLGTFNYLSTHFNQNTNRHTLPAASNAFLASDAYALPYQLGRDLQQMQAQVDAAGSGWGKVHFAMTEWYFGDHPAIAGGDTVEQGPASQNEGGALMAAGIFNTLIRNASIAPIANITGIMQFAGIRKRREQVYAAPAYSIFRLYASSKGETILPVTSDSGTYDVHGGIPGYEDMLAIPYVDVVATLSRDRNVLTLFCVNRDLEKDHSINLDVRWLHVKSEVKVDQMKVDDRLATNSETNPQRAIPISFLTTLDGKDGVLHSTLPRESVTVLHFHAEGAASKVKR